MKSNGRVAVPVAALIAAAATSVFAQEADIQSLISPNERSVELGVLGTMDANRTTGMYTGQSDSPVLPIVNGTLIQRDEATGTWVRATGIDLGLSSRELGLEYERQGDSKYFFNFNQIQRTNPLEIVTGLTGTDSNRQLSNGTALRELKLETDRYNGTVGMSKMFSKDLDVQVSYRGEYKEGGRAFGVGFSPIFLVDPIEQYVHEVDAKVNYAGERLQLTGGFLGSLFENTHKALYVDTTTTRIALPPDNEAYNVYLSGGYNFTPKTRGDFKISHTLMLQNDAFFTTPGVATNSRRELGGEVENYLVSGNLRSQVTKDLSLLGKLRWENRSDDTPVERYVTTPSASRTGFNIPLDRDTVTTEGEATYRLPENYRITGGVKYEHWERGVPAARQASWRTETDEYSGRAQLSKMLTETLGGSVAYIYSTRTGSAYFDDASGISAIDPIHWGDRERHLARMNVNWAPSDVWSVQGVVDGSVDTYHSRTRPLGPEEGSSFNSSLDATYQLTPDWGLTGFVSRNEISREQKTIDSEGGIQGLWSADLKNMGYTGGVSLEGKATDRLKLTAGAQYSYDKQEYELKSSTAEITDLPDIAYRQFDLKLSGDYTLSPNGTMRVGYVFTHLENSDFTYDVNIYTDDTVIGIPDSQNSHFIGVSYIHRW